MPNYSTHINTRATPQTSPIFGRESEQVQNNAGGYVFPVDMFTMLDRFLILGAEGGTYYASERELTIDNAKNVVAAIKADGPRVVARIVEISQSKRAPKNDPALFALALACTYGNTVTKSLAYAAIPKVARIGTHLFHFVAMVNGLRGWGRGITSAVAQWYAARSPLQLAQQLTKYPSRDGWSHMDVLRVCHAGARLRGLSSDQHKLFGYAVGKMPDFTAGWQDADLGRYLEAVERVKHTTDAVEAVRLITEFALPREVLSTELLTHAEVWDALLPHMGLEAMVRNLATMTRVGLVAPLSNATAFVRDSLTDADKLKASGLHPVKVLAGMLTYSAGCGMRGSHTWTPVAAITDALNEAFYGAFGNVPSTGKRHMLALDCSTSMEGGNIAGVVGLTPRVAAAAMAMVTARSEPNFMVAAFTAGGAGSRRYGGNSGIQPLDISPTMRLEQVVQLTARVNWGGTDCALPMLYAHERNLPVDAFCVYTDNETWAGEIQPAQALQRYRRGSGHNAKLVVAAMTSTGFSIADPRDAGMLDVVGFDTAAPTLMADFIRG